MTDTRDTRRRLLCTGLCLVWWAGVATGAEYPSTVTTGPEYEALPDSWYLATAMDVVRVIAWLWGEPLGERRRQPGHLAQLAPHTAVAPDGGLRPEDLPSRVSPGRVWGGVNGCYLMTEGWTASLLAGTL